MAHRPATMLGLASGFILALAPCGTASAQCEATETAAIVPADTQLGDQAGNAVAIYGDACVAGAPFEDEAASGAGAAYVFRYNGDSWAQEQKLMASDPGTDDNFGTAVAMSGNVAVIGAPRDNQGVNLGGSAYVFRFNGTNWVQEQKLFPSNPLFARRFGTSVAIDGNVAVVGAPRPALDQGAAYVFRYLNNQWVEEDIVVQADGATDDRFGTSVAIAGDIMLVGANRDDDLGLDSGSAYVFRYQGGSGWVQEQKLTASDGQASAGFGFALSLSGGAALIGANNDVVPPWSSGAAYVFRYDGQSWNQEEKFSPPAAAPAGSEFGCSVSLHGNVAAVASMRDDGGAALTGTAYLYSFDGSTWTQQANLMASDGIQDDLFGRSIALQEGTLVVGADDHGLGGCGYIFAGLNDGVPDACAGACPWDLDGGGAVGVNDFLSLLAAWGTNPGGPPDFDGNGIVGITDFLALLSNWGPCP